MPVRTLGDFAVTGRANWQVIPSATTISPKQDLVRVTGVAAVVTINRPSNGFVGPLRMMNTDASVHTWTAAGNIALAGTSTRYKVFEFMYDPTTNKWYPNAVA